jgi:hypothetical protein
MMPGSVGRLCFRKSVEARFGEDGAREILRASAAGRTFEHPSLQSVPQHFRDQVASLYCVVRNGELQKTRMAESEHIAERQTQGARLRP